MTPEITTKGEGREREREREEKCAETFALYRLGKSKKKERMKESNYVYEMSWERGNERRGRGFKGGGSRRI